MKTILVVWEGPFNYNTVINDYYLDNDKRCDFGLYQIYGPHELYMNKKRPEIDKVLLYIGMTISGSTFSGRISKHGFCHGPEYEIYLGRIEGQQYDDDLQEWENDIKDVEKILINKYAPSYNGSNTGDLREDQLTCFQSVIMNQGKRMDLDYKVASRDVVYKIG